MSNELGPSRELLAAGRVGCIVADPPWSFNDRGSRIAPDRTDNVAKQHYQTMALDRIIELTVNGIPVPNIAADNAHLYLWVPDALIFTHAVPVLQAWGFQHKLLIKWIKKGVTGKIQMGMGHYFRRSSEVCIFAVRGRCPAQVHNLTDVIEAPRTRHSAKPVELMERAEKLSPGPYLELFARQRRPNWIQFGDQLSAVNAPVAIDTPATGFDRYFDDRMKNPEFAKEYLAARQALDKDKNAP